MTERVRCSAVECWHCSEALSDGSKRVARQEESRKLSFSAWLPLPRSVHSTLNFTRQVTWHPGTSRPCVRCQGEQSHRDGAADLCAPPDRHGASVVLPSSASSHHRRIVSSHRDRVVLRDLETLQIIRTWSLPLTTSHVTPAAADPTTPATPTTEFAVSPTSPPYLLIFAQKARTAWILDPEVDGEKARIEIGNEGAVALRWADSPEPTVMSWSAHHASRTSFADEVEFLAPSLTPPSAAATLAVPDRFDDVRLAISFPHPRAEIRPFPVLQLCTLLGTLVPPRRNFSCLSRTIPLGRCRWYRQRRSLVFSRRDLNIRYAI